MACGTCFASQTSENVLKNKGGDKMKTIINYSLAVLFVLSIPFVYGINGGFPIDDIDYPTPVFESVVIVFEPDSAELSIENKNKLSRVFKAFDKNHCTFYLSKEKPERCRQIHKSLQGRTYSKGGLSHYRQCQETTGTHRE